MVQRRKMRKIHSNHIPYLSFPFTSPSSMLFLKIRRRRLELNLTSSVGFIIPRVCIREIHDVAAAGFRKQAEGYERTRPSYPAAAVNYVAKLIGLSKRDLGKSTNVLDLAAGGGKFTCLISKRRGFHVVAVEPVLAMREVFQQKLPEIPCLPGTADKIPCRNQSFDAVTIAQAFHWMSTLDALRDIHRVLRPGGLLALLWNMESRSVPWVASLRDIYEKYDTNIPQYRHGDWKEVFLLPEAQRLFPGPLTTRFFQQDMLVTKERAWERVLSKSYIASLTEMEQAVVRSQVEGILHEHRSAFSIPTRNPVTSEKEFAAHQLIDTEVTYIRAA